MLADPMTGVAGSFKKITEAGGSVYQFPFAGDFIRVSVKHTVPAVGKTGVSRHLVSVSYPNWVVDPVTSDPVWVGTYATVNLTLTNSNTVVHTGTAVLNAFYELLKFMSTNGTAISSFGTDVLAGIE
jgi:hypothetical protein